VVDKVVASQETRTKKQAAKKQQTVVVGCGSLLLGHRDPSPFREHNNQTESGKRRRAFPEAAKAVYEV